MTNLYFHSTHNYWKPTVLGAKDIKTKPNLHPQSEATGWCDRPTYIKDKYEMVWVLWWQSSYRLQRHTELSDMSIMVPAKLIQPFLRQNDPVINPCWKADVFETRMATDKKRVEHPVKGQPIHRLSGIVQCKKLCPTGVMVNSKANCSSGF